ncbi:hypothetical protein [Paracoccus niistensis]|uniref:hypothetical protein n=1 Tax=Paracoccus niistensis TaxID=632935 RepID=UPI00366A9C0C
MVPPKTEPIVDDAEKETCRSPLKFTAFRNRLEIPSPQESGIDDTMTGVPEARQAEDMST